MGFEFDDNKNRINLQKHGIDFYQAQLLWQDDKAVVMEARFVEEERFRLIGKIGDKHWCAVFTMRGGNIRLISVCRASRKYVKVYDGNFDY